MFVDKSDLSPYYYLISLISAFNMTFYCLLKINFPMQTDQIFADFPEVMEKKSAQDRHDCSASIPQNSQEATGMNVI